MTINLREAQEVASAWLTACRSMTAPDFKVDLVARQVATAALRDYLAPAMDRGEALEAIETVMVLQGNMAAQLLSALTSQLAEEAGIADFATLRGYEDRFLQGLLPGLHRSLGEDQ